MSFLKSMIGILIFLLFQASAFALSSPQVENLPNGLKIAWLLNDNLPMLEISAVIKVGYRDDPQGKSGLVDLLTATIDRGSEGKSAHDVARSLDVLGATLSSSVDDDSLILGVKGLSSDSRELLRVLSSIVLYPDFPESEAKKEQLQMAERMSHLENYNDLALNVVFRRMIAAGTSYGRGGFESIKDFKKISRADLIQFYKAYFTPKNSLLLVVGRGDRAQLREQIMARFGSWSGDAPKRDWKNYSDPALSKAFGNLKKSGTKIAILNRPGLAQAQVRIGFRVPPMQTPDHYPLAVVNAFLGDQFNSRLNRSIRDKLVLTYGIRSGITYSKEFADFSISCTTRNETVGQLVSKTIEILKSLKSSPASDSEIESAKTFLVGGFPVSQDTLQAVASRWLVGELFGLDSDFLNEFTTRISAVKKMDIERVVQNDFDLDQLVVVITGDAKEIEKSLHASKMANFKQISTENLMQ